MQVPFKFFILLLFLGVYVSCQSEQKKEERSSTPTETASKIASLSKKFPDILNYKGIPDSATDRSVFMFSDLGAWNGYALPDDQATDYYGSFVGPFTMMQDNGVWMSNCLAKLSIASGEKLKPISFDNAKLIENSSYPNQLKQVFVYIFSV